VAERIFNKLIADRFLATSVSVIWGRQGELWG